MALRTGNVEHPKITESIHLGQKKLEKKDFKYSCVDKPSKAYNKQSQSYTMYI